MATATETARVPTATPGSWPAFESVEESARRVGRALTDVRHKAEDAAAEARLTVRRHPLASVATGVAAGAAVGAACGLFFAWLLRPRE